MVSSMFTVGELVEYQERTCLITQIINRLQSLPCDRYRYRPFVNQVLQWVEEVRENNGGAPTWGVRRRCQGRGRARYSWGARDWVGSPCPTGHNKMGGIEWRWGRPHRKEPSLQTHGDTDKRAGKVFRGMFLHCKTQGREGWEGPMSYNFDLISLLSKKTRQTGHPYWISCSSSWDLCVFVLVH